MIDAALSRVQSTSLSTLKCLREFKPSWNKTYEDNKWGHFYWGSERSGLNWPRKKKKLGKNVLAAFHMEFAQREKSGAVACQTRGHNAVVPRSPFQPCVQSIVVLEHPSEVVTQ